MEQLSFEQGPIRPPSEARSLFLRVTRSCSWNNCQFCSVYKDHKFERHTVEKVKADIDTVVEIIKSVKSISWKICLSGQITQQVAQYFFDRPGYDQSFL
jgi:radical SAM superfamily enzyme YgiQ (UPF0313 family)